MIQGGVDVACLSTGCPHDHATLQDCKGRTSTSVVSGQNSRDCKRLILRRLSMIVRSVGGHGAAWIRYSTRWHFQG
jgi:hypothetical protein